MEPHPGTAVPPARYPMIRTVFRKYDGSPHRLIDAIRLGEDEHGLWVGSVPGTPAQRADGTWVTIDHYRVRLYPHGQWWSALFNDDAHPTRIYVDVTTPPEFGVDCVTTTDLDLDIRLRRDGTVQIYDEEEFQSHQTRYNYPPQVIATARTTCDWIATHVTTTEPFLTTYKPYLQQVLALSPN